MSSDSSIFVPRQHGVDDISETERLWNENLQRHSFSFSDVLSPLKIPTPDIATGGGSEDLLLSHWVTYELITDPQFQTEIVSDPLFIQLANNHQEEANLKLSSPQSELQFLENIVDWLKPPSSFGEASSRKQYDQISEHEVRSFASICERFRSRTPRYSDSSPLGGVSYQQYDRSVSPGSFGGCDVSVDVRSDEGGSCATVDKESGFQSLIPKESGTDVSQVEDGGWVRRLPSLPEERSFPDQHTKSKSNSEAHTTSNLPPALQLASDSLSDVFSARGDTADRTFSEYIANLEKENRRKQMRSEEAKQSEYSSDSFFQRSHLASSLPSTPSHSCYKPLHPPPQRPIEPKGTSKVSVVKQAEGIRPKPSSLNTRVAGLSIKKLRSKLEKRKKTT